MYMRNFEKYILFPWRGKFEDDGLFREFFVHT